MSNEPVLLHTEGFTARDGLVALARRKAGKLLRHDDRLVRIRLTLVRETPRHGAEAFAATAILERAGRDAIAHAAGDSPEAAVHAIVDKLERMITARTGARRRAVQHPHPIELAVALPKAG